MGWRDGSSKFFKKWLEKNAIDVASVEQLTDGALVELFESAFNAGYSDGWGNSKNYDPKWDAD